MRQIAIALMVLSSCFEPGEPPLVCSDSKPGCPSGKVCVGGMCLDPESDLGSDLSSSSADMSLLSGCANGKGLAIGLLGCWGCAGTFSPANKAATLCASTHKLAINSQLITDSECQSVKGGFFLSAVFGGTSANYSDPRVAVCGSVTVQTDPTFFGCGEGGGLVNANVACNGFRLNIQCQSVNGISCSMQNIDSASNTKANNGALCCPK